MATDRIFCLPVLLGLLSPALATEFYVDNRVGSDTFDGRALKPLDLRTGPLKTISRALALCDGGDVVVVANNPGKPYYETLHLFGEDHSGEPGANFTIVGNGAVVCGLREVPFHAWRHVGDDLWTLNTHRRGHVMLLLDGVPVPRRDESRNGFHPADLSLGEFCLYEGLVYFRGDLAHRPPEMNFAFAKEDVGLTCYHVHDVTIRDLHFRHFRLDGVAAPDSARRITLLGVTTAANGRAGVSVGGISTVRMLGGEVRENLGHSILVQGPAAGVGVEGTALDREPTVVP